ncbi:unnamed protein product [Heligmosomoides polygyrus]|uniref:Reverse transcriptase domain-containing protein n=1 Tax=Heligmosomoides polygyrus TaxID=6339 RepID=A0A183GMF0_HELPZ|nr:unnamed protein product [Heligmosomoides polygyrus]
MERTGAKIDDQRLHHHFFADDTVLRHFENLLCGEALVNFDHVCGNAELHLNLTETMFVKKGRASDAPELSGTNISECSSYV